MIATVLNDSIIYELVQNQSYKDSILSWYQKKNTKFNNINEWVP